MTQYSFRLQWPVLIAGLIVATICALGVHVFMLQVLHVPFPNMAVLSAPMKFVIRLVATFGLLYLWSLARPEFKWTWWQQWLVLFLVYAMLRETLIRAPFMNGYCTDSLAYTFVANIRTLLNLAVTCGLVVLVTPWLRLGWHRIAAALAISALAAYGAAPWLATLVKPMMASIAHLAPKGEWCTLPYGAEVLAPAFLSYIEAVLAALAVAALAWRQLAGGTALRLLKFTVLVMAIQGQLLTPFICAAVAEGAFLPALASEGQFALESLLLGLLVGGIWQLATRQRSGENGGR